MFLRTEVIAVGVRGPFQTKYMIAPVRRNFVRGEGFNPKAVAAFTARANDLARSSPSQNHMWGANLSGKLDR